MPEADAALAGGGDTKRPKSAEDEAALVASVELLRKQVAEERASRVSPEEEQLRLQIEALHASALKAQVPTILFCPREHNDSYRG